MTDDPASPKPPRAEVTSAWLVENRAKCLAYEEQRRRHTRPWHAGGEPELESEDPGATTSGRARKPSRGKIHDRRLSRAVAYVRNQGVILTDEELSHVAPVRWDHIALTGDYLWSDMDAPRERFRPLRTGRFRPEAFQALQTA